MIVQKLISLLFLFQKYYYILILCQFATTSAGRGLTCLCSTFRFDEISFNAVKMAMFTLCSFWSECHGICGFCHFAIGLSFWPQLPTPGTGLGRLKTGFDMN